MLDDDRYFDPNPSQKSLAIVLHDLVRDAPTISPHDHVAPALFSQPDYHFSNLAAFIFQSVHYILQIFYSQGISYDILLSNDDPYKAWEVFTSSFFSFEVPYWECGSPTN